MRSSISDPQKKSTVLVIVRSQELQVILGVLGWACAVLASASGLCVLWLRSATVDLFGWRRISYDQLTLISHSVLQEGVYISD